MRPGRIPQQDTQFVGKYRIFPELLNLRDEYVRCILVKELIWDVSWTLDLNHNIFIFSESRRPDVTSENS
jgi:hypothetical protein